jgi:ParB-like chromosome segregation protein Spo0J
MEQGSSVKLEKVGEEIEYIRNPEIGKIYMADPRQFNLSKHNPRVVDPDREIQRLEDSILKVGFRLPAISDLDYNIICGGRRWRIALKYGLKFPVIFYDYSSDLEKILDAFLENAPTSLTSEEERRVFSHLKNMGLNEREISEMTTRTEEVIGVVFRGEIPDTSRLPVKEASKIERKLRNARTFVQKLLSSKRLTPEQTTKILLKVSELPKEEIKQLEKEARSDLPIDVDRRIKPVEKEHIFFQIPREVYLSLARKIKSRNWDLQLTLTALVRKFVLGDFELDQKDYEAVLS